MARSKRKNRFFILVIWVLYFILVSYYYRYCTLTDVPPQSSNLLQKYYIIVKSSNIFWTDCCTKHVIYTFICLFCSNCDDLLVFLQNDNFMFIQLLQRHSPLSLYVLLPAEEILILNDVALGVGYAPMGDVALLA